MRYKLEWQTVFTSRLHKYYNADPVLYAKTKFITRIEDIDEDDWHTVTRLGGSESSILEQFDTLKKWAEEGTEPIRNVHLYKTEEPSWIEVTGREPDSWDDVAAEAVHENERWKET